MFRARPAQSVITFNYSFPAGPAAIARPFSRTSAKYAVRFLPRLKRFKTRPVAGRRPFRVETGRRRYAPRRNNTDGCSLQALEQNDSVIRFARRFSTRRCFQFVCEIDPGFCKADSVPVSELASRQRVCVIFEGVKFHGRVKNSTRNIFKIAKKMLFVF